ncbi:Riboflavin synthase-like beta-barrel [Penicillium taxi]|uniref:Riboflavin synthase-like beta-barrel n=1 Tax=Penicillium taxi TaxID=168475 RepID=UPI002545606E|nr:Riboflavin synthase-like beta-barrel [Penicillium taxi]KAJ5907828.1 Riboflavin synthase-like beta-barrel [Penicillium taxi]
MALLYKQILRRPIASAAAGVIVSGVGAFYGTRLISTGHAESTEPQFAFRPFGPHFTSLRLRSSEAVSPDTKRLVFEFPDENAKSGLTLTLATLVTLSRPEGLWLPVLRPYTPISPLDQRGSVEFMVKHYPNGKASTHLHSLKPGDSLTFAATIKRFSWTPNKFSQVYLIAGGTGITPIYQLIQGILNNPNDKTKVNLVFGVNSEQDLLLRDELELYKKRFPDRFDYIYTVSHSKEDGPWKKGYVTEELLRDVVYEPSKDTHVFVCGPPRMETFLVGSKMTGGILKNLGFTRCQIHQL